MLSPINPSPLPKNSILWMTDPWNTLDHSQDTTLRLIQEGVQNHLPMYWSCPDYFLEDQSLNFIRAVPGVSLKTPFQTEIFQSSKFHQIFYRCDPPLSFSYFANAQKLWDHPGFFPTRHCLENLDEKIPPPELDSFRIPSFFHFKNANHSHSQIEFPKSDFGKFVVKPLASAQSKGVRKLSDSDTPESLIRENPNGYLIQPLLDDIHQGEIRLWFAGGKFIAALKKYPLAHDFRVQIDQGSRLEAYHPTPHDHTLIQAIEKTLEKYRIPLAAVDLIGNKICDFNFTSPGLLVQLEKLHQKNFAKTVLERIMNF